MSLATRVARLEDGGRDRQQRCRWCASLVIFPARTPRGPDGKIVPPPCENPALCPGPSCVQIFLPERRIA